MNPSKKQLAKALELACTRMNEHKNKYGCEICPRDTRVTICGKVNCTEAITAHFLKLAKTKGE